MVSNQKRFRYPFWTLIGICRVRSGNHIYLSLNPSGITMKIFCVSDNPILGCRQIFNRCWMFIFRSQAIVNRHLLLNILVHKGKWKNKYILGMASDLDMWYSPYASQSLTPFPHPQTHSFGSGCIFDKHVLNTNHHLRISLNKKNSRDLLNPITQ